MNGKTLKIIALITMIIDHFAASILLNMILYKGRQDLIDTYYLCRHIGRIAFPIYIFLLIQGFANTRNLKKYIISMAVFAAISEIPFDIALGRGEFPYYDSQNVFITLFLALTCLYLIKTIREKFLISDIRRYFLIIMAVAIISVIAYYVRCDYKYGGVIAAAITYYAYLYTKDRFSSLMRNAIIIALCCSAMFVYNSTESYAFLAGLFVIFYNGERGSIRNKFFYYAMYPAHLLLFGCILRIKGIL